MDGVSSVEIYELFLGVVKRDFLCTVLEGRYFLNRNSCLNLIQFLKMCTLYVLFFVTVNFTSLTCTVLYCNTYSVQSFAVDKGLGMYKNECLS